MATTSQAPLNETKTSPVEKENLDKSTKQEEKNTQGTSSKDKSSENFLFCGLSLVIPKSSFLTALYEEKDKRRAVKISFTKNKTDTVYSIPVPSKLDGEILLKNIYSQLNS